MCNVDTRRAVRKCRVNSGTTISPEILNTWRWKRRRWLDPRRIFKRLALPERRFLVWSGDVYIRMDMHAYVVLSCGSTSFHF